MTGPMPLAPNRRRDPVRTIIGQLRYAGMRWEIEDGSLFVTGNTAALTDAHRAAIAAHRPAIIRTLDALPAGCVVPHMCCDIGACRPDRCEQAS